MTRLARRNYTKVVKQNKKRGWRRIRGGYWIPRYLFSAMTDVNWQKQIMYEALVAVSKRIAQGYKGPWVIQEKPNVPV